jgi:hypothetical protein
VHCRQVGITESVEYYQAKNIGKLIISKIKSEDMVGRTFSRHGTGEKCIPNSNRETRKGGTIWEMFVSAGE